MSTGTGQNGPELNVTPFIDILLVLLIIFIVLATSMGSKGEQALIPQPATETTPPRPINAHTIVVRLLAAPDGSRPQLRINKDPVSWTELHDRLFAIYAARVEKVAFVQADKDVTFDYVAEVIDTVHSVDVDKVGLIQPNTPVGDQ